MTIYGVGSVFVCFVLNVVCCMLYTVCCVGFVCCALWELYVYIFGKGDVCLKCALYLKESYRISNL